MGCWLTGVSANRSDAVTLDRSLSDARAWWRVKQHGESNGQSGRQPDVNGLSSSCNACYFQVLPLSQCALVVLPGVLLHCVVLPCH